MDKQHFVRHRLIKKLEAIKNKNPLYSYRAFARDLNVSASTLLEFLNKNKELTPPLLEKLADQSLEDATDVETYRSLPRRNNPFVLEDKTGLIQRTEGTQHYTFRVPENDLPEVRELFEEFLITLGQLLSESPNSGTTVAHELELRILDSKHKDS